MSARRVLIAASEEFELAPIRQRLSQLKGFDYVCVARGPGSRLVTEALRSAGDLSRFDAIVSTGLCGGLEPELRLGDIVVGNAVNGEPVPQPGCRGEFLLGPVISVDAVAGTVAEKRRLRSYGAIAVEMEAATVAAAARQAGRPFYCVKVVSDTAEEEFALDLNAARDAAGRFRVPALLRQALCRPRTRLPELIRLRHRATLASRKLGEFIAACQF
jgi:adenosylhomocysteine nucleosidase